MTDPELPPEDRPDEPSGRRGEEPERPEPREEREQREQRERQELDIEAEFAAIVAAWDGMGEITDTPADPVARWPVSEDLPAAGDEQDSARDENGPSAAPPERQSPPEGQSPAVWRQGPDPLAEPIPLSVPMSAMAEGAPDGRGGTEAEEQFIPPDPPPLGRVDPWLRFAWLSVFGGPLFLIACLFLMPKPLPTWIIAVGVGGFVGGFAMLVARMPVNRDDDDDGAVV